MDSGFWDVGEADYHASPRVSHHKLEVFRASVPRYAGLYVDGTLPQPKQTDAMRLGAALHCLILEPDLFPARYAICPDVDGRTKAGKAVMAEFRATTKGMTWLDQDEVDQLCAMRAGVLGNTFARRALEATGRVEQAIRWTDPGTGLEMRSRLDKLTDSGLLIDLKTTGDVRPDAWAREVWRYGYHRQAALYLDGILWACGMSEANFLHIAVSKEPPHECACYTLDCDAINQGQRENMLTLVDLLRRTEAGDWSSPWAAEVGVTRLPRWAADLGIPY